MKVKIITNDRMYLDSRYTTLHREILGKIYEVTDSHHESYRIKVGYNLAPSGEYVYWPKILCEIVDETISQDSPQKYGYAQKSSKPYVEDKISDELLKKRICEW